VIGVVDHSTGTRDADVLGRLAGPMPVTAAAAALAALSMAGIIPFLGFIAKEVAYAGAIGSPLWPLVTIFALAANALMVAVAAIVAWRPFFGPQGTLPRTPHEGPWAMLLGPVTLAVLGLVLGLSPGLVAHALIEPAANAVLGYADTGGRMKLWAGFNLPLLLSVVTFLLGILLYLGHQRLRARIAAIEARGPDFDAGWDRLLEVFMALAKGQTRLIQTGVLRHYLFATFTVLVAAVAVSMLTRGAAAPGLALGGLSVREWGLAALILVGTAGVLVTSSLMTAIISLGVVGIGVALVFIIYSAPDVAITQLLVELLVVVLFAVAALKMPELDPDGRNRLRRADAVLAIAAGTVTTLVLLMVTAQPFDRRLTTFFEGASYSEAYGRNIVNVILVDFRALDTFGEIAVVVTAALGAFALLKTVSKARARGEAEPGETRE
jgi:multicomponent Na+:H+ antiporter subunit A